MKHILYGISITLFSTSASLIAMDSTNQITQNTVDIEQEITQLKKLNTDLNTRIEQMLSIKKERIKGSHVEELKQAGRDTRESLASKKTATEGLITQLQDKAMLVKKQLKPFLLRANEATKPELNEMILLILEYNATNRQLTQLRALVQAADKNLQRAQPRRPLQITHCKNDVTTEATINPVVNSLEAATATTQADDVSDNDIDIIKEDEIEKMSALQSLPPQSTPTSSLEQAALDSQSNGQHQAPQNTILQSSEQLSATWFGSLLKRLRIK